MMSKKTKLVVFIILSAVVIFLGSIATCKAVENIEYAKYVDEYSVKVAEFNDAYAPDVRAEMVFDEEDQMMIEIHIDGEIFVINNPEMFDFLIEMMAE